MRDLIASLLACNVFVSACTPSLSYRIGQGYYSETFAEAQLQAAASAGQVTHLGRFSVENGGCGNYSQDMADQNIVIPAIRAKLKELGGNVAANVVANEQWYDFILGLFILPGLLACSNWTISGEALRVEQAAGVYQENAVIFFADRT